MIIEKALEVNIFHSLMTVFSLSPPLTQHQLWDVAEIKRVSSNPSGMKAPMTDGGNKSKTCLKYMKLLIVACGFTVWISGKLGDSYNMVTVKCWGTPKMLEKNSNE